MIGRTLLIGGLALMLAACTGSSEVDDGSQADRHPTGLDPVPAPHNAGDGVRVSRPPAHFGHELELDKPFCERSYVESGDKCGEAWCGAPKTCVKLEADPLKGWDDFANCVEQIPEDFSACTVACKTPGEPGCACPAGAPIEQLWEYRAAPNRYIDGPALLDGNDNLWFVEIECKDSYRRDLVSLSLGGQERFRQAITSWYLPRAVVGDVLVSRTARVAPDFEGRDVRTGEVLWRRSITPGDLEGYVTGRAGWLEVLGGLHGFSLSSPAPGTVLVMIDGVGQPGPETAWMVAIDTNDGTIRWNRGRLASGGPVREDGSILVIRAPELDSASLLSWTGEELREIPIREGRLSAAMLHGDLVYGVRDVRSLVTGELVGDLPLLRSFGGLGLPRGYHSDARVAGRNIGYTLKEPSIYYVSSFDTATGAPRWGGYRLGGYWHDRTQPLVTDRDTLLVVESLPVETSPDPHNWKYQGRLYEMNPDGKIEQSCELPLDDEWTYMGYPLLRDGHLIVPERRYPLRRESGEDGWAKACRLGFGYGFRAFALPDRNLSPVGWPTPIGQHDGTRRAVGPVETSEGTR